MKFKRSWEWTRRISLGRAGLTFPRAARAFRPESLRPRATASSRAGHSGWGPVSWPRNTGSLNKVKAGTGVLPARDIEVRIPAMDTEKVMVRASLGVIGLSALLLVYFL